jgi:hypothetical protein
MQFLRGKYVSDNFLSGDQVAFRWYTPTYTEGDNSKESISAKAIPPLDSEGKSVFHFTGLKHGFAGV